MSEAEQKRLDMRIKMLARHGINVADHTSDGWLALAEDAERTKNTCGPSDPAFEYFFNQARRLLDAACVADQIKR